MKEGSISLSEKLVLEYLLGYIVTGDTGPRLKALV
jgi:hypothetical protein